MWLIYALGGGWGHLTRAIALARIAQRGRPVRILTNSPYAEIARRSLPELDLVALNDRAAAEETRAEVFRQIAESRPECLIVDTFPRGIGGELAPLLASGLHAARVLIHRDLNPRYVESARLREFVAAHYDQVLVPGAGEGSQLGEAARTFETLPWLVRSAGEIPDGRRAKEALRLHEDRCMLVCASGKAEELEWYGAAAEELRRQACPLPVRCVAAEGEGECWVRYWPAMDLFGCTAVVIGGAGYNTVQECLAWDVPLVARPWPRAYDRQELRARRASARGRVIVVRAPEEAARAALEEIRDRPPGVASFANGTVEAVERIAQLLS